MEMQQEKVEVVEKVEKVEIEVEVEKVVEVKEKPEIQVVVPAKSFYGPATTAGRVLRSSPNAAAAVAAAVDLTTTPVRRASPAPRRDADLKYPDGVVKKTWAEGHRRMGDCVTIDEVLQKDTLTTTVLSAFQWDYQWIMGKLPLRKPDLKLVLVMQGKEPGERAEKEAIFLGLPKVTLVFPNMDGQINCMHSKLMLLFHKSGDKEWLRIAVPSANLTDYDWGYCGGIMENSVFMIDLPRLPSDELRPGQTFFMESLQYFCTASDIPADTVEELCKFDFSKTAGMAFVHSIGGSHTGENWNRTGFPGLGEAVKTLGLASGHGLEVDFVTSSLGAAKEQFVFDMYHAAQGQNGLRALLRRNKRPNTKKALAAAAAKKAHPENDSTDDESELDEETDWERVKSRFRIYFPSRDTVENSAGGFGAGGTVCFQQKWWGDKTFPKQLVCDCVSNRRGMLMHNKMLFARPSRALESKAGVKVGAWAYVGSANFSESAWGKLVIDRSTKQPKLNCKNWECGVVLAAPLKEPAGRTLSGERPPVTFPLAMDDAFAGVVPVPMEAPGEPLYANGKQPWYVAELQRIMMGGMG
ncbi:putative tyrosyl-DNA phosphodiesterase [Geopyxis carbonaria]|nr:putative tyrosyl-DNA phosphodiesterase [Geopyxis carbonaria]